MAAAARYAALREKHVSLPPLPSHTELKDKLKLLKSVLGFGFFDEDGDHTGLYEDLIIAFHAYRFRNRADGGHDSPEPVGPPAEFQNVVADRIEGLPAFLANKITSAFVDIRLPCAAWFELFEIADELLAELYTTTPTPRAQSAPTPREPPPPSAEAQSAAKRSRSEEAPK